MTSPTANSGDESSGRSSGVGRLAQYSLAFAWVLNAMLLAVAFGWIYFSGESRDVAERLLYRLDGADLDVADPVSGLLVRDSSRFGIGVMIGTAAVVVAACTLVGIFGSLFVGGPRFQSVRMWLLFTALVGGWLGLIVGWPEVYWRGQQRRVEAAVPAAESMVQSLERQWPTVDGDLPGVGPFLAYPIAPPAMLMPLTQPTFPNSALRFSAVERSGDNVMRFELADDETGAWLEWRRDDSEPRSFAGGLETHYELERTARLAPHWFLVRYASNRFVMAK